MRLRYGIPAMNNNKPFSLEQLKGGILKSELSTFGGNKSLAMKLAKQLVDTMRENERLLNAIEYFKLGRIEDGKKFLDLSNKESDNG